MMRSAEFPLVVLLFTLGLSCILTHVYSTYFASWYFSGTKSKVLDADQASERKVIHTLDKVWVVLFKFLITAVSLVR